MGWSAEQQYDEALNQLGNSPMETNTIFADGFFFDKPREGAPDFVKGRVSIKVAEAIPFLEAHKNEKGYVNIDLLKSKEGGKLYFKLNTYKKEEKAETAPVEEEELPPF